MDLTKPKPFQSQRDCYLPAVRFYTKRASSSRFLARISRFINKYFYRLGLGSVLNRYDNSITLYSSRFDKKLYASYPKGALFCNFGSGAFFHKRWKNYDYPGQSDYYKSIQGIESRDFISIDLCAKNLRVPEEDESVSLIYCSHTLEHLDFGSAKAFLAECYRILKPNGIMRVALPNTANDFNILGHLTSQANCDVGLLESFKREAASHIVADTRNKLIDEDLKEIFEKSAYSAKKFYELAVNAGISVAFDGKNPERHITFWDYGSLISVTTDIGFSMCIPIYQGSSFAKPFTNISAFDSTEAHISFYSDIVK